MNEGTQEKRRLDAIVGREGKDGKTYWTKLGVAFATRRGHWEVRLDAMPAPTADQGFRFLLVDPDHRRAEATLAPVAIDGDDIPF